MENFDISLLLRREEASVQNYYNSTPIIKTYYRFKTKVQDGKWRTIHAMRRTPWLSILVVCKRQESVPCRHPSATIEPKIVTHVSPWKEPTKKFFDDLYKRTHIVPCDPYYPAPVNKRLLCLEPPSFDQLLKRWFVFLDGLMPNKTNTTRQRKLT